MKKALFIALFMALITPTWGEVKTDQINLGVNGGSDADGAVTISRPSSDILSFKSVAGTFTLAELATGASATTRTGLTRKSAIQGAHIVAAGDSNTRFSSAQGADLPIDRSFYGAWPQQMEILTQANPLLWDTQVFNEGVGGETAVDGEARFSDILDHPGSRGGATPDIIILAYGTNDVILGTSSANFSTAIESMIDQTIAAGAVPVIVNIPDMLYSNSGWLAGSIGPIANDAELDAAITAFNLVLENLANEKEAAYFDLNELLGEATAAGGPLSSTNRFFVVENESGVALGDDAIIHFSYAGQRHLAVELLNFMQVHGLVNGNSMGTRADILRYNDPRISLLNVDTALTTNTNLQFALTSDGFGLPAETSTVFNLDYRLIDNDSAGDLDVISLTFTGTGIAVVCFALETGILDITLDSMAEVEVDTYRAGDNVTTFDGVSQTIVWQIRDLDHSEHTLVIEAKNTKNAASNSNQILFAGLLVERGSMNDPIISQFPFTATAPALLVEPIATSDESITTVFSVTGDNTSAPFKDAFFQDLDFEMKKTGSEALMKVDMNTESISFRSDTQDSDFHVEVTDFVTIRNTNAGATLNDLVITREDFSDGDLDRIGFFESVGGVIHAEAFSAIESVVEDATGGSIDGQMNLAIGVDDVLIPIIEIDELVTQISSVLTVHPHAASSGISRPASAVAYFESAVSANVFLSGATDSALGFLIGDSDNQSLAGLFYSNVTDTFSLIANTVAFLEADETAAVISYGDSRATTASLTDFMIEDDHTAQLQISGSSVTLAAIIFGDEVDNENASIKLDNVTSIMSIDSDVEVRISITDTEYASFTASEINFNDAAADVNLTFFEINQNPVIYGDGEFQHVGVGTAGPGIDVGTAAGDYTPTLTLLHVDDDTEVGTLIVSGATAAAVDLWDTGAAANDKAMRWIVIGGTSTFQSLDDDLSLRTDDIMEMDLGTGNVGMGKAPEATTRLATTISNAGAGYAADFRNVGNNSANLGVSVWSGTNADTQNVFLDCFTGNGLAIGDVSSVGAGLGFNNVSDARRKKDIVNTEQDARSAIQGIPIRDFKWKKDKAGRVHVGVIAQEVEAFLPNAVVERNLWVRGESTTKTVNVLTTVTLPLYDAMGAPVLLLNGSTATTTAQIMTATVVEVPGERYQEMTKMVRPLDFIPVLWQETQRQQREIELLWGAIGSIITVLMALIVAVIKLASGTPLTPDDIKALQSLKKDLDKIE